MTELVLTVVVKKERRGGYSSLCPELDVASRGDSPEDARENLRKAIRGHLQTAKQEGLLGSVLAKLGLTSAEIKGVHHVIPPVFSTPVVVPLPA